MGQIQSNNNRRSRTQRYHNANQYDTWSDDKEKRSTNHIIENNNGIDESCQCRCQFLKNITSLFPKSDIDPMGTPIPDTPLQHRKERHAKMKEAFFMDKNTNRNDGYSQHNNLHSTLEKERSVLHYSRSVANEAQIHEGQDAERLLHEKYQFMETLGVGSTSTVHRCINRKTDFHCACKVIDKNSMEERFVGMLDQFQTEVHALRRLQHPNIIQLYDVYTTDQRIYIIMELMEGGELFDYVVQKGTLNEEEASRIVRKVTSALVYMHSKDIVHRDLKPENLLLRSKPRNASSTKDIDIKIIDFGLSKAFQEEEEPVARSFLGTRGYIAPEMLQRREYTRAIDSWALGVIVFVLLCGCLPFDDDSQAVPTDDIVRTRFQLRFPRWAINISSSAKDLLSHLLDVNPKTRYTAEQALYHPWIQGTTARSDSLLSSPGRIKKTPMFKKKTKGTSSSTTRHQQSTRKNKNNIFVHKNNHNNFQQSTDMYVSSSGKPKLIRKTSV